MKHLTRQPDEEVGTITAALWKGMGSRTVDGLGLHGEALSVTVDKYQYQDLSIFGR